MKKNILSRKFHNDKGYSLIELVVVIAIMVILVAVMVPMLYNGPSNRTRQDVSTFDSMIGKNAVLSMAQQNRALELAYDSAEHSWYVATVKYEEDRSVSPSKYIIKATDDKKYFVGDYSDNPDESIIYQTYSADTKITLNADTKIYFRLDKTKGNFKTAVFTDAAGNVTIDNEYIKNVYFNIKDKTRGCRLYRDTGKHDVFKE